MAGSVRDLDLGFRKLQAQLRDLAGAEVSVLVGVHGERDSDMVVIAASNEYGTTHSGTGPGHNVPERSYLRSTVDNGQAEVLDDLQAAVGKALDGADLDQQLGLVGEKWVGRVKETIKALDTPPNAPSTIAAKKGADNPLIDTGRLRNSITWALHHGDTERARGGG